jgi:hypothetical protein
MLPAGKLILSHSSCVCALASTTVMGASLCQSLATETCRWVYIRLPAMLDEGSWLAKSVSRAWHPLSLAGHHGGKLELLIDVHKGVNGQRSWSELLFHHLDDMQKNSHSFPHVGHTRQRFDITRQVDVRGPFGSAFSRCFETMRRTAGLNSARYDLVILYGSGIGLPSALSALKEFIERRRTGKPIPQAVWFMWQCRHAEDLQLCWDSLHRVIYAGGGLADEARWNSLRLGDARVAPIDRGRHLAAHGATWTSGSTMLDWLGVSLHVSRLTSAGRQTLETDNPLHDMGIDDDAAHTVHGWLTDEKRLQYGYHDLAKLLTERIDRMHTSPHAPPCKVCVSLCGSQRAMLQAQTDVRKAATALANRANLDWELAADYHN